MVSIIDRIRNRGRVQDPEEAMRQALIEQKAKEALERAKEDAAVRAKFNELAAQQGLKVQGQEPSGNGDGRKQARGKGGSPINPNIVVQTGKEKDWATIFMIIPVVIIAIVDKLPILGGPYVGFTFDILPLLRTSWYVVLTSTVVIVLLIWNAVEDIIHRDLAFIISSLLIITITRPISRLVGELPILYSNSIVFFALALIFLLLYKFRDRFNFSEYASYIFMVIVFSFFFVNQGWTRIPKAIVHAAYIGLFFFYMSKIEKDNPSARYILIPVLLLADFYGYSIAAQEPLFRFVPILAIFVTWYCYIRTNSKFAMGTFIAMFITIIILTWGTSASAQQEEVSFIQAQGAVGVRETIDEVALRFKTVVTDIFVGSVDYATGGLYSAQVEKNQFEPLGVYFDRVRDAQPRFYANEKVTLWGTIKSRTLTDPVVVDFTCYRWKEDKRHGIKKEDGTINRDEGTLIPEKPFTVYTLEEKDVECTFAERKLEVGTNRVILSASYNFATSAYQKAYFIDKERMQAMVRENIDPLKEFGIKEVKPETVFTNGPVAIFIGVPSLTPVSEKPDVKPTIGIKLANRDKIANSKGKVIGEWKGKIKKINELVVVVPDSIEIEKDTCTPVTFSDYTLANCDTACRDVCKKACEVFDSAKKSQCIDQCNDRNPSSASSKKCNEECSALFKSETPNVNYKGYRLNVEQIDKLKNRDDFKDIDRYREFVCRINPTLDVLENVPITTKFIRARARYDYLLENSFDVAVNPEPGVISGTVEGIISKYALEEGIDPDLIKAIAYQESSAAHCKDGRQVCPKEQVKLSPRGISLGIMQINIRDSPGSEWAKDASAICGVGKTAYDADCNIRLGIKLLRDKYNQFKDGITEKQLLTDNRCPKDKMHHQIYLSYRGWDAALRGYNGLSCGEGANVNYVTDVNIKLERIKSGILKVDLPVSLRATPSLNIREASYNSIENKITIRWDQSSDTKVKYYLVTKYFEGTSHMFEATPNTFIEDKDVKPDTEYRYIIMAVDKYILSTDPYDVYNIYGMSEIIIPTKKQS